MLKCVQTVKKLHMTMNYDIFDKIDFTGMLI